MVQVSFIFTSSTKFHLKSFWLFSFIHAAVLNFMRLIPLSFLFFSFLGHVNLGAEAIAFLFLFLLSFHLNLT